MSNSDRFLNAFNKIEKHLRVLTGETKEIPFGTIMNKAASIDSTVRYYSRDLREFADLRNAIVHESTDGHVLAEPNDRTVGEIERIIAILIEPPNAFTIFKREVLTFETLDSIATAVRFLSEKSFSQAPVYESGRFVGLLSSNTITRWLGRNIEEDIISLSETPLSTVLDYTEDKYHYKLIARNASIFSVIEAFIDYNKRGEILEAIFITDSGKKSEKLLGIITTWDLPEIYSILEKHG